MANNYDFQSLKALIGNEADNNDDYYRDPERVTQLQAELVAGKKDVLSQLLARWVRQKKYGIDVREAFARGIEWMSVLSNKATDTALSAQELSEDVSNQFTELETKEQAFEDGLLERYNRQIAGNTDLDEVIDARDSATGENYSTLGERLNMLNETELKLLTDETFQINPEYDIGGSQPHPDVKGYIEKIKTDAFNVTVVTDSHYQEWYLKGSETVDYPNGHLALNHLNAFLEIARHTDLGVALGDNVAGNQKEKERTLGDLRLFKDKLYLSEVESDIAIMPGNHDDASAAIYSRKMPPEQLILDEEMKQILQTAQLRFGETREEGDSLYFFKDYPEHKIRVIGLYSEDVPELEVDAEGTARFPRWLWHGYRQNQINWLANVALRNVPADYHVMFLAHSPLNGNGWEDSDEKATYVNNDIVIGLIDAFQQGKSYTKLSDGGEYGSGWAVNVAVDFSTQGSRVVIGWFNGHKHRESLITPSKDLSKINMCMLLNDICTNNSLLGTVQEMAMTTISVDTKSRQVTLHGFGRATNRTFNY